MTRCANLLSRVVTGGADVARGATLTAGGLCRMLPFVDFGANSISFKLKVSG